MIAAAVASGDTAEAAALLAPDAVAVTDGGAEARAARRVLKGAAEIAQVMLAVAAKQVRSGAEIVWTTANGRPALAVLEGGEQDMLMTLAPDGEGRIAWIYIMRNPRKLPSKPGRAPERRD